jgi:hypothetical protein
MGPIGADRIMPIDKQPIMSEMSVPKTNIAFQGAKLQKKCYLGQLLMVFSRFF